MAGPWLGDVASSFGCWLFNSNSVASLFFQPLFGRTPFSKLSLTSIYFHFKILFRLRKRSETRVVLPVRDFILACPASSNQKMTERMEALKMIPLEGIDLISREQKNLTDTLSDLKSGIDSRVAREKSEMELAHRVVLNEKAIKTNKLQGEVDRLEEAVATNERANQL